MPIKKISDVKVPSDFDPFPFGKYKDTSYEDVPVEYLHWCRHNCRDGGHMIAVNAYIDHNLMALMEENGDLIWSK